jgi:hypothetical protein
VTGRRLYLHALCLAASLGWPAPAVAQASRPYSIDQVAEAVATDLGTRILEQARANCISFVVDPTAVRRLRAAGADADFTGALRDVCYKGTSLEVTTVPAGADVWVRGRAAGKSPWMSPWPLESGVLVEVRLNGRSRQLTADLVPDSLVTIEVSLPRDTFDLPPAPADEELRMWRAQAAGFDERAQPKAPTPPGRGSGTKSMVLGALGGVAAGLVAGTLLCQEDVITYKDSLVGNPPQTVQFQTGTDTHLRSGCVAFSVGGGAVGGALVGNVWSNATTGRRRRRYDEAVQMYERELAHWNEQRRASERARNGDAARAELARILGQNAAIKEANANLGEPRVTVGAPARLSRAVPNYASQ